MIIGHALYNLGVGSARQSGTTGSRRRRIHDRGRRRRRRGLRGVRLAGGITRHRANRSRADRYGRHFAVVPVIFIVLLLRCRVVSCRWTIGTSLIVLGRLLPALGSTRSPLLTRLDISTGVRLALRLILRRGVLPLCLIGGRGRLPTLLSCSAVSRCCRSRLRPAR